MWEQIVLPRFGKMKVAAISHEDIDDLHRDITTIRGTPIRANRMVEVLRKAFNLSIRWKWRDRQSGLGRAPEPRGEAQSLSQQSRGRGACPRASGPFRAGLGERDQAAHADRRTPRRGARRELGDVRSRERHLDEAERPHQAAQASSRSAERATPSCCSKRSRKPRKVPTSSPERTESRSPTSNGRGVRSARRPGSSRRLKRSRARQGHAGPQRQADHGRGAERASPRSSAFLRLRSSSRAALRFP